MSEKEKCPFCGTYVAHSPFGHVWCDQCDYRLETEKFENRPTEDALRAEVDALKGELGAARALVGSSRNKHHRMRVEWRIIGMSAGGRMRRYRGTHARLAKTA